MSPTYVGRPRWQFDPKEHGAGYVYTHEDCWAAAAAWGVDSGSRGALTPTDQAIRHAVGKDVGDPKVVGPGNIADTAHAAAKFGIGMQVRVVNAAEAARLLSTPAELVLILPTDFHLWPGGKTCQPGFTGLHMVGVVPGAGPKGALQVMNPLCKSGVLAPRFERVQLAAALAAARSYGKMRGLPAGSIEVGVVNVPKPPAPPRGLVDLWCHRSTGAPLRAEPRRAARILARVAYGSRLQVAPGPSGATAAASGVPSPVWAEVHALQGHLITPPLWARRDQLQATPPPSRRPRSRRSPSPAAGRASSASAPATP